MKRHWKVLLIATAIMCTLAVLAAVVLYVYSVKQNQTIGVTRYTVSHEDIPAAFEGKRIVQLTDLHNKDFGDELTALVAAQSPDIIVITGDWIGYEDTDITPAKAQATALVGIAPTYYVTGNHEARSLLCDELLRHLESVGVTLLRNETTLWEENGESIQLIGTDDPEFSAHLFRDFAPMVNSDAYTVLLYHRPEYLDDAVGFGADLIFAGHTHGGQIRLPLIGAVYAPNQGFFPTYDVGRFDKDGATMILSQGLGESVYMRILTPPEIVVVTLDSPHT